jgi:acyl-CoA thioesterase-2
VSSSRTEPRTTPSLAARLVRRLDLAEDGPDSFVGQPGRGEGAVFGGLLLAQAVMAVGRTASDRDLHSLHAYFLRPGKYGVPIRFRVTRVRNGTSFAARSVVAEQAGKEILHLTASFTVHEKGFSHQDTMPAAPPPEGLPEWEEVRAALVGDPALRRADGPIEVRLCEPESAPPGAKLAPRRNVWLRPRGKLPADGLVNAAFLVYASDRTLLRTAARPHGLTWRLKVGASLDHAVWLHRPPRFDDWLLYATSSPVAHGARALLLGAMYRRDGTRIASIAQEGLLRV